jgi:hypothetical protein
MPHQEDIASRLYNLARLNTSYVFVDRFRRTVALTALEEASLPDAWFPLQDEFFEDLPQRSPALLQIGRDSEAALNLLDLSLEFSLQEVADPAALRTVCGWVFGQEQPHVLARAFSRGLDARVPGGRIYLRFFDPRVLPRLVRVLGPSGASVLLPPESTWCALGRDGGWMQFTGTANTSHGVLSLDEHQAAAVARIQEINDVARMLAGESLSDASLGHEADAQLDAHLSRAQAMGLGREDRVTYAVRAQREGKAFSEHAGLPAWIREATSTGLPLQAVLESWSASRRPHEGSGT